MDTPEGQNDVILLQQRKVSLLRYACFFILIFMLVGVTYTFSTVVNGGRTVTEANVETSVKITVDKEKNETRKGDFKCSLAYSKRQYLSNECSDYLPPMLYTFPGSGNTWFRLLIEFSTGVYSGSVYGDKTLIHYLPGERTCSKRVSVIKVHPFTHAFTNLSIKFINRNCNGHQIDHFERAILLIRNPYDAIWSEYQRKRTDSHTGQVTMKDFLLDQEYWIEHVIFYSKMYNNMWNEHYKNLMKTFPSSDFIILRYEDLLNFTLRTSVLKSAIQFIFNPFHNLSTISKSDPSHISDKRILCAFEFSETEHRQTNTKISKKEIYNRNIVCSMWNIFGSYAAMNGYKPYNDFICDDFHYDIFNVSHDEIQISL